MTMTVEEVRARVEAIDTSDSECAHADEDDLYKDVLAAIRDGAEDAPALAREALRVAEFNFSRWYA